MEEADWLVPDWPAPANVNAVCSTRGGGVSEGAWSSLNLGDHVRDDPRHVAANRAVFAHRLALDGQPARPVFLQQVHGTHLQWLEPHTPDGVVADACAANQPGVACVIMVADCLPVLLCDAAGRAVAAAHAGWRGLAGGVLERTVRELSRACDAADGAALHAWLGPCIGATAFEVGAEVKAAFVENDAGAEAHFRPHGDGKYLADLAALARRRLAAAGVASLHGNDGSQGWCTVSNPARFFSYRRDQRQLGASGRLAAAIWLGA